MVDAIPSSTFTLRDEENNEYVINEFKVYSNLSGVGIKNKPLIITYYKTSTGLDVEHENSIFYLKDSMIKLLQY